MKKVIISLFLICALSVMMFGCSEKKDEIYTVEYGETFQLPKKSGMTATVTDANGSPVFVQYGSFIPQVGEYTATYSGGGKKATIKIVCRDTIEPSVTFAEQRLHVSENSIVEIPGYTVYDKSLIASEVITVNDSAGNVIDVNDGKFFVTVGQFTVVCTATDSHGNVGSASMSVITHFDYIDETLAEGVLFDFDEEEYLNLIYSSGSGDELFGSIVRTGYPEIENESSDNGVLRLHSDAEWSTATAQLKLPVAGDVFANDFHSVTFKVAVDKYTEQIKVYNSSTQTVVGSLFGLEPDKWYDLDVDLILYGYTSVFNNIQISAKSDFGVTVYIDQIEYLANVKDVGEYNGIESFNDENYRTRVFQNKYNKEVLGEGYGEDGSVFSIKDSVFKGESDARTVLNVETFGDFGGLSYFFQEQIDMSKAVALKLTMSAEKSLKELRIGCYCGNGKVSEAILSIKPNGYSWSLLGKMGEMKEYVIPISAFNSSTSDGYISGIWVSIVNDGNYENSLSIDDMTIIYNS